MHRSLQAATLLRQFGRGGGGGAVLHGWQFHIGDLTDDIPAASIITAKQLILSEAALPMDSYV